MPSPLMHSLTSIWYGILVVSHPLDNLDVFGSPALNAVPKWAVAGMKGNFYGTTSWLALAAYLHFSWRSVTAEQLRLDRGRWREIKVGSAIMCMNLSCLGVYYFRNHVPGVWIALLIPAVLEAVVFITT